MSNYGKGIPLASGFDLGAKIPLDARTVVNTIEERDAHVTNNRVYVGMRVFVSNENKEYLWNGTDWELVPNKTYVDDAVANVKIDEEQLANYATKDEIPTKTSQLTNDSNFTTESYVTDAINNASVGGGEGASIDLSVYQTKVDANLVTTDKTIVGAINELDVESIKAEDFEDNSIIIENNLTSRVSSLETNKADISYVDEAIANAQLGGGSSDIDLSKYTTKDYVDYQIENHTHPKVTNEDIEQIMNDIF